MARKSPWAGAAMVGLILGCEGVEQPAATVAVADSADQVIFGLEHNITADGVLRAWVEADTAFFYQASQVAELRNLKVIFFDGQGGESSTLTALEGTYQWRGGDMEARRNVVGVTPDGKRLTTSVLVYQAAPNQLVGPEPFVFDAPDRHLEGNAFTSDPSFSNVEAQSVSGSARRGGRP